jgi:hypothetical protein
LPRARDDFELQRLPDLNTDPTAGNRPNDYRVNAQRSTFTPLKLDAVGSSTLHWSTHCPLEKLSLACVRLNVTDGETQARNESRHRGNRVAPVSRDAAERIPARC